MSSQAQRVRHPRLCGKCRCPGHTSGKCNVVPVPTEWFAAPEVPDMSTSQAERYAVRINAQARMVCDNIMQLRNAGATNLVYRDKYLRRYYESVQNDPTIDTSKIPRHVRGYNKVDAGLKIALNEKSNTHQTIDYRILTPELKQKLVDHWTRTNDAPRQQLVDQWLLPSQTTAPPPPPEPQVVVKEKVIDEKTCSICMDELTECNRMVGACGHQFHATCMMSWASRSKKCPCCRTRIFE